MDLRDVCVHAGREPQQLTRRDVARALLAVPPGEALESLPKLRRELLAAGRPASAAFWESSEEVLTLISEGPATVVHVHRWLEATGAEPTQLVGGGFVWPDEGERGPVARDMHGRLVAHLEHLVTTGEIDPDRLLAGDPTAIAAYEQAQVDWLYAPLDDGRQPIWAVSDEEDEEFLAAWDEAEADARQYLAELVAEVGPRPCPEAELQDAVTRLRDFLADGGDDPRLLHEIAGNPTALPRDDRELWLELATGVVTGGSVDPTGALAIDDDSAAAWLSLEHADWIAVVVTLARLGPGADADADALAGYVSAFDDGDDGTFEDDLDGYDPELSLSIAFHTVVRLWRLLGAVDGDERLTRLGWWGLPEALDRAWQPTVPEP